MGLKAINGYIALCQYCGEQCGNNSKYCPNCKTRDGRKKIFDENAKICKENEAKGYNTRKTLKDPK